MGDSKSENLEQVVWEPEERFRAVVQSSPMGMHLYQLSDDDELVFVGANPAADQILGVGHDQFIGKTIEQAFPGLVDTEVPQRYRDVCRGAGPWKTEQIDYQDSQIAGAFEVHAFRIGPRAMAALFLDITERARTIQALHISEEEHRNVVEMAPYAIAIINREGRIERANSETARLHGFASADEIVGRTGFELIHEGDHAHARAQLQVAIEQGSFGPSPFRYLHQNGSIIDAIVMGGVMRDQDGEPQGFVILSRDAAKEKRQSRLIELQRDLAQGLATMTSIAPALELCIDTAIATTSIDSSVAYLVDTATGDLTLESARGVSTAFCQSRATIPKDAPVARQVRSRSARYFANHEMQGETFADAVREGLRSGGAIPICHEGEPIACLTFGSRTKNEIPDEDRNIVESIAAQLGGAIARLRAAEALRKSEEQHRLLIENQSDLVAKIDIEGRFLFVSPSFCKTFGKPSEAFLGQHFSQEIHERETSAAATAIRTALMPPHQANVELRMLTTRGWRWFSWRGTGVRDEQGRVHEIIGVGRDITEQKEALDDLAYRGAFETLVLDISTHFINVEEGELGEEIERALEQLRQLTRAEGSYLFRIDGDEFWMAYASGESARAVQSELPERIPIEALGPWRQAFSKGRAAQVRDVSELPDDALAKAMLERLGVRSLVDVPLKYGDTVLGFVGFLSSRSRTWGDDEQSLLKLVAQVFTNALRREEHEQSLKSLHQQLLQSQKMEAIGRLAGGVAHDFNNLLTGIIGYAEIAASTLAEDDPLTEDLSEILGASRRAASLTSQLLAFSRRQVIHPQILNLNQIVRDSQRMLGRIIGEDIELKFEPGQNLGAVKTDPAQVDQVLVNLATNSRDAMPNGGQLTIETRNAQLDAEYARLRPDARAGDFVMLAVSDSGTGMDADTRQRVFEPFFSTKEKGKGTGLGLSTVYGIVRQNAGFIEVESNAGVGTTVRIYYPRVHDAPSETTAKQRREPLPGGSELILLVEDESMVRDLARRILNRQGYRVLDAAGGGDAFLMAERETETIHLLLTDVVMPKMNGRELYERLIQQRPQLKVVFMSGYTDDIIAQHGVLDPETVFIQKPFAAHELLKAVRRALDS